MKIDKLNLLRDVAITPDHWDIPVFLQTTSYVQLCRRIDASLRQLVARWGRKDGLATGRAHAHAEDD